jgi:hypothetical protein
LWMNLIRGHIPQKGVAPFFNGPIRLPQDRAGRTIIMKKVVFIVSGGELGDPSFLREQTAKAAPADRKSVV